MGFAVAKVVQFLFEASPFDSKIRQRHTTIGAWSGHNPRANKKHALADRWRGVPDTSGNGSFALRWSPPALTRYARARVRERWAE